MSRSIGAKTVNKTPEGVINQQKAALIARERSFRVGNRQRTYEDVAEILSTRLSGWIDGLHHLANNAESESVRLEAAKYLVNRVLGSPVEVTKVQQMQPVEVPTITISSLIPGSVTVPIEHFVKTDHDETAGTQH